MNPAAAPVPGLVDRLAGHRAVALALFAIAATITRGSTLGDWNLEVDSQFYLLAGRRLLDGALLYVDLWDRKPPGLYLVHAALAALPWPVIAAQVFAAGCTALAAYGVHRIALPWSGPQGSLLAGLAYCVLVTNFGGLAGQAPILFNPLMICAFAATTSALPALARGTVPLRVYGAMGGAGLAIAIKQSAAIEAGALVAAVVALAWRGGMPRARLAGHAALLALTAGLPMALTMGYYRATGHYDALWQALVLSNIGRVYDDAGGMAARYATMGRLLGPALLFAALGLLAMRPARTWPPAYRLALGWALVAMLGIAIYPGLLLHYALPLLAPLCLLSAPFFARHRIGPIAAGLLVATTLVHSHALDFAARARSRAASAALVAYLRQEAPGHRVLVFNRSPWLLALTGSTPPTPLQFPPHLYDGAEARSSGLDSVAEMHRVLAWQPEAVVIQTPLPARPLNVGVITALVGYLPRCARQRRFVLYDQEGPQVQRVFSGCATIRAPTAHSPAGFATGR